MEFICALSVNGSLATYRVRKENEDEYTAVLQTPTGRSDVPAEILLKKSGNEWSGTPQQEEIVRGLVHAIEATGPIADDRLAAGF